MTDDEAQNIGEFNMRHSHATHDLYNAIADGNYPKWGFYIQTLDPADEHSLDFDPLDCTKVRVALAPAGIAPDTERRAPLSLGTAKLDRVYVS